MNKQFSDIPGYDTWVSLELLSKGWSTDRKYIVKTKTGEHLLLRIADGEWYEQKRKEYDIICKYAKLGFEMSNPLDFGLCDNGEHTYMLLTWVEGEDLEVALPKLTEEEQYKLTSWKALEWRSACHIVSGRLTPTLMMRFRCSFGRL